MKPKSLFLILLLSGCRQGIIVLNDGAIIQNCDIQNVKIYHKKGAKAVLKDNRFYVGKENKYFIKQAEATK